MTTGALIVAAGMSSRMGDFKPMLNIGSISIAQRVIATFQQAGVEKIVMVTGYNAAALERHLAGNGVVFLRNENFETTQMFDSARIGLAYLRDKCDRVLFTPGEGEEHGWLEEILPRSSESPGDVRSRSPGSYIIYSVSSSRRHII